MAYARLIGGMAYARLMPMQYLAVFVSRKG
jgi:hypothetical protein